MIYVQHICLFLGDAICVVIHPFPAQLDSQMSLRAGEVVKVLDKEENGWWRGVNQTGQSGWFPGSYVETARYGQLILIIFFSTNTLHIFTV